jgi:isochorismate synthase
MTEAVGFTSVQPQIDSLLSRCAETPLDRGAMLSVSAPVVSATSLIELSPDEHAASALWSPRSERATLGLGVLREFSASGATRFERIEQQASEHLASYISLDLDSGLAQQPRALGGFSFAPGDQGEPWQRFGEARFVLPRWRYERDGARASLSVLLTPRELGDRDASATLLRRTLELRSRLSRSEVNVGIQRAPSSTLEVGEREWERSVRAALLDIRNGELQKVVAARHSQLDFDEPLALGATLHALQRNSIRATCFCFRFGDVAFLGATPERLIRRRGLLLDTEALAGTFRRTESDFAAELLRSPKEHAEHAPVLKAIIQELSPLCSSLSYAEQPEIRELKDMLHLRTPIRGRLSAPQHILQLVERLHPTPAVGGVPTDRAMRWIRTHETHPRGWYAGPIGWFDAQGDGEFAVALRSGILQGNRATLFAGGGIVQASEPDSEYRETELKLFALKASLRTR